VDRNKCHLKLFSWINEETWGDFVRLKTSAKFLEKSKAASMLTKKYKNHHRMGTVVMRFRHQVHSTAVVAIRAS
jgi:hypothetical protein